MLSKRITSIAALAALVAVGACDNDPDGPNVAFSVACPTGLQGVNTPLSFAFTGQIDPNTVAPSNIVVTDAVTGKEIAGSVARGAEGSSVVFTASDPLPFDTTVTVRFQNLLPAAGGRQLPVTICRVRTEQAPIRELYWRRLPEAGGNALEGVAIADTSPNSLGFVISRPGVLYRRDGTIDYRAPGEERSVRDPDFTVAASVPYLSAGFDVAFVNRSLGFASFDDVRDFSSRVLRTRDAGATFDTIATIPNANARRLFFRKTGTGATATDVFGVIVGGSSTRAEFRKYNPITNTVTLVNTITGTGGASDVDFALDTLKGSASSFGIKTGNFDIRGNVFRSVNGGASWAAVPGALATSRVQTYRGTAIREDGTIFVVGGNAFLGRIAPTAGAPLVPIVVDPNLSSLDSNNVQALVFNDIAFARDNDQIGWIVGARQTGVVGGVPQFQGLIYITRDGGNTWIRQGVRGAEGFGGEFPALNRISVASSRIAWIVGDAGAVLVYNPPQP